MKKLDPICRSAIVLVVDSSSDLHGYLFEVLEVCKGTVFIRELPRPSDNYGDPPRGACLRSYHVLRDAVMLVGPASLRA